MPTTSTNSTMYCTAIRQAEHSHLYTWVTSSPGPAQSSHRIAPTRGATEFPRLASFLALAPLQCADRTTQSTSTSRITARRRFITMTVVVSRWRVWRQKEIRCSLSQWLSRCGFIHQFERTHTGDPCPVSGMRADSVPNPGHMTVDLVRREWSCSSGELRFRVVKYLKLPGQAAWLWCSARLGI